MKLNVSTHFSQAGLYNQTNFEQIVSDLKTIGADGLRDSLSWSRIEETSGTYNFESPRTSYLDDLVQENLDVLVTFIAKDNDLYQGGRTVTKDGPIEAFATYVDEVLDRFPDIREIEIGNEFNGLNTQFVNGLAATKNLPERAAIYTDILKAVHDKISVSHPDVTIVGGAMHSFATGYVGHLAQAGAFEYMDAVSLHPYGQSADEAAHGFERLNDVLDQLPASQRPEIYVTEFGQSREQEDIGENSVYLSKMAAIMSANGVSSATWYVLLDDDEGTTPNMGLYDAVGDANPAAAAFSYAASVLDTASGTAKVDAGTGVELYDFGNGTWIVWGAAQDVTFTGNDLVYRDVNGEVIDPPTKLDTDPIYIEGADLNVSIASGPGGLVADSHFDFELSPDPEGPWSYHALKDLRGTVSVLDLDIMDGQTRVGELWNPYLGSRFFRPFAIGAEVVRPTGFGDDNRNERSVLERFTVEDATRFDIVGSWSVNSETTDGVRVEILHNGESLTNLVVLDDGLIAIRDLSVSEGDLIDFVVHDNGSSAGDPTERHIQIWETDPNQSTEVLIADHLKHDFIEDNEFPTALSVVGAAPVVIPPEETAIVGTSGADRLDGTSDDDIIYGEAGQDRLRGRNGDDMLFGGNGKDILLGGSGNDRLDGGAAIDTLTGNKGADTFVFDMPGLADIVTDFDHTKGDVLDLTALNYELSDLFLIQQTDKVIVSSAAGNIAKLEGFDATINLSTLEDAGALLL